MRALDGLLDGGAFVCLRALHAPPSPPLEVTFLFLPVYAFPPPWVQIRLLLPL